MNISVHRIISIGSLLLGLAVAAGAFGAHALKAKLSPYGLSIWDKATFYQFIHGGAIVLVGMLSALNILSSERATTLALVFLFGVSVFCGSLYALAITEIRWLGAITPIGGTAFLIGWFGLSFLLWRH